MGTHVHCGSTMSAYSALHLLRSYNHLLGPPADGGGHAYPPLLAPRPPPEDFNAPAALHAEAATPSPGALAPFGLSPFVPPGLLGAFPPYPPLLPFAPEVKPSPADPLLSRALGAAAAAAAAAASGGLVAPSLAAAAAAASAKRPRGEKKPIPDDQKDEKYYERRKRNNQAAKKSRDARKMREDQIALRATMLEHENAILRAQVLTLREEAQSLRHLLLQRKAEPPPPPPAPAPPPPPPLGLGVVRAA